MSCSIGPRHGLDMVLWLWHRLEAVDPIRPLAWEPPCAAGGALKGKKKKKREREKKKGALAVAQQVKNPTAVTQVAVEAWVRSLTQELRYAAGVAIRQTTTKTTKAVTMKRGVPILAQWVKGPKLFL